MKGHRTSSAVQTGSHPSSDPVHQTHAPSLTRRRLARRFKRAEWLVDGLSLAVLTGYILYQYSWLVLNPGPATGGDTGSHFWTLWSLVHHGISSGVLRPWNPGNMGGEPILLHYFPFSFLLMWVLALFVPIGMAFNLGTMLWAVFFPISMYACLRGTGNRFPIPILGAAPCVNIT